jgi:hypothetical protein
VRYRRFQGRMATVSVVIHRIDEGKGKKHLCTLPRFDGQTSKQVLDAARLALTVLGPSVTHPSGIAPLKGLFATFFSTR